MTGHTPPQSLPEDQFERTDELPALDINAQESVPAWARARADEAARSRQIASEVQLERARVQAQEHAEELARQLEERRRVEETLRDEVASLRARAQDPPFAAALTQAETRIQQLVAMAGQHSALLAEADAQIARLTAAAARDAQVLEESQRRCQALEAELARREPSGTWVAADADGAAVQALQVQLAAREAELQGHRENATASTLWQRELLCQMRLAEESLRRRETELTQARASEEQLVAAVKQAQAAERAAREELAQREAVLQELRQALEALQEEVPGPFRLARADGPDDPAPAAGRLPAGVTRLLVRTDSDAEKAHVLGERTSIGRSADNDLQVDVTSISRHHALIMAGPAQTVIEDLHSTNGVRVNGRRIKRQSLRDGDTVLIGKAQFRFVLRAVVDAG